MLMTSYKTARAARAYSVSPAVMPKGVVKLQTQGFSKNFRETNISKAIILTLYSQK